MKKLSNTSYKIIYIFLLYSCAFAQEPFLEIRPYIAPSYEQYPAAQHVDHHHPYSNGADSLFLRFDGIQFTDDVIFPECISGSSCYDGHAGIDYYMPFDTPILAPANGYVLWASFSAPADPCPGGIDPNGDQGTIIIAHGNDYFTVYLHMNPPLNVSVGDNVETGDTLGFTGNTGCAINAHLHFEVRKENWFFDTSEPYAVDPFGWWNESSDPIEEIRGNRSEWLWVSDSLIDDGDNGFQRFKGPDWVYLSSGFNNNCWTAPATNDPEESRHYAVWVPYLENAGEYNIEAFFPADVDAVTGAIYEINVKNEDGTSNNINVIVNQTSNPNHFTTIATLDLPASSKCSVILRDVVHDSSNGVNVVFDAIRFTNISTAGVSKDTPAHIITDNINIDSVYPNPFNASTTIRYSSLQLGDVYISIIDVAGDHINTIHIVNQIPGTHLYKWMGTDYLGHHVPSGIYFLSVASSGTSKTRKIILLK